MNEPLGTVEAASNPRSKGAVHPLAPLSPAELEAAVAIIKEAKQLQETHRFVSVWLHEPDKLQVLSWEPGQALERRAFAIVYDRSRGTTYEAVVSL
ncbi:MAG TPA: tyramine oxidase, partial [Actinomycetota bacterium]|nr:tyramine oxidase [Actinomycetota bacterium]